jgi:hypothetical protein
VACCVLALQVFADYKTRGPVILKPSDTTELIEKLEDSQMQLGSLATNRQVDSKCLLVKKLWLPTHQVVIVCVTGGVTYSNG